MQTLLPPPQSLQHQLLSSAERVEAPSLEGYSASNLYQLSLQNEEASLLEKKEHITKKLKEHLAAKFRTPTFQFPLEIHVCKKCLNPTNSHLHPDFDSSMDISVDEVYKCLYDILTLMEDDKHVFTILRKKCVYCNGSSDSGLIVHVKPTNVITYT